MKKLSFLLMILAALAWSCQSGEKATEEDTEEQVATEETEDEGDAEADNEALPSPRRNTSGTIGEVTVTVDWGSPGVKGREVYGSDLVPFDEIWRAGANENTTIEFSQPVVINGSELDAGKYGFFIIATENGPWTAVFSNRNDAWGHYEYDQAEDALRVEVSPMNAEEMQERLIYEITGDGIRFAWENKEFLLPVTTN